MSELSFTAKQAAEALGASPAQARRYGAALEEVTGELIARHPRDGRLYRRDQIETMGRAKVLVEANPGLTITQALTLALGGDSDLAHAETTAGLNLPAEAISEALERALARSLLPELQGLRAEVAALRSELAAALSPPLGVSPERIDRALTVEMASERSPVVEGDSGAAKSPRAALGEAQNEADGPMVRAARWLEQRFRGR